MSAELGPIDMSALHTVLAEFNAETQRLLRKTGARLGQDGAWQGRLQPKPAAEPVLGAATPIAASQARSKVAGSKSSGLNWQSGEKL